MSLPAPTSVLKPLTKYLTQSKQLERVDPLVAYYTRLYALQLGMKIANKTKDDLKLISEQMNWLEKNQSCTQGLSKEEGRQKAETFALQVFQHGDDEDRAGLASKKTALNFHAAYVLMDVCRQFSPTGDLPSDMEEKQRYAIVKAADINKAIKEGRKPKAGPLNEPSAEEQQNEDDALLATLGASPVVPTNRPAIEQKQQPHFGTATSPFSGLHIGDSPSYQPPPQQQQLPQQPQPSAYGFADSSPPAAFNPSSYQQPYGVNPTPLPDAAANYLPPANPPNPAAGGHPASSPPSAFSKPAASSTSAAAKPSAFSSASHSHSGGASPFSPQATAARNQAGAPASKAFSQKDPKKTDAIGASERLIKHALSAVVFADVDTTVAKLREALAILAPYASK